MTEGPSARSLAESVASHSTFFRQSGWMMVATIAGGLLMWAVHLLSKILPATEYGTLITLLAIVNLVPTMPLQMVFTQQAALAIATDRPDRLAGLMRGTLLLIFLLWLGAAAVVISLRQVIATHWHLASPAALPMMLLVVLLSLCWPVLAGVMQGRQNFLWLGWCAILNGAGRIVGSTLIVMLWHGFAVGIMVGIALGLLIYGVIGAWQTRAAWRAPAGPFNVGVVFGQMAPLMLGFAAMQFLFSADTPFVNAYFGAERTAPYGAAGTLARALLWLVLPLANVMFPKIVQSHVHAKKTNLLPLTLLITGLLGTTGFLGLWLAGPWIVPFIFPASYTGAALAVLPWYAAAMIPLVIANVLLNDFLARSQFQIVPPLILLAVGYGLALTKLHDSTIKVLQVMGAFNVALLLLCLGFTRRPHRR